MTKKEILGKRRFLNRKFESELESKNNLLRKICQNTGFF